MNLFKPVVLTGRMPFRVEYSSGLIKNGASSYKNPYWKLYANPYSFKSQIVDNMKNFGCHQHKRKRILEEYKLFYSFKERTFAGLSKVSFTF